MSEEGKKVEKPTEQSEQEIELTELSEPDLEQVAGGSAYSTTKSNIRTGKL